MLRDLRHGLRLIRRQPAFALAAILTLALGLGANTAIFTVAWQLMLKPLPYPSSDRLVEAWETTDGQRVNPVAPVFYNRWLHEADLFESLASYGYFQQNPNLTGAGEPEQLVMRNVTGGYFRVFATAPLLGRVLDDRDIQSGAASVVLSEGLWRRRFGADPAIVGRPIVLFGGQRLVVGVMPAAFESSGGRVDLWSGLGFSPAQLDTGLAHYLVVVGRLKPGVSVDAASRQLATLTARDVPRFPLLNQKLSALARSMDDQRGGTLRTSVVSLVGAAGLVLLIACANLASLQLARGVARQREFGIRAAIGASRARLVRQILVESLVLAVAGAAAGLLLSSLLLSALVRIAPPSVRIAAIAGVDSTVLLYTLALAAIAALLFAWAPAWRASSRAAAWLRQRTDAADLQATLARSALVAGQVALAVVLVIGASLLVSSLSRLLVVNPGFDPAAVLAFDFNLASGRYDDDAKRLAFMSQLGDAVGALPGVTASCAINGIPFDADAVTMTYVPDGDTRLIGAFPRTVAGDCFSLLKVHLVRGRLFGLREPTRVGIVTESFAAAAWPGEDAIGRRLHLGVPDGALIEVVGVVTDSLQRSFDARPYPQVYEAARDGMPFPPAHMLVRASVPPDTLFAPVREAVRRVDPDQPVARLRALTAVMNETTGPRRFNLLVLGGFAVVAFVLALVGIVGLEHETVAERRAEIGIRLALGATAGSVVRLVLTRALAWVAAGLGVGLAGAWFASRVLQQQLFGVTPTDPVIYLAVAFALGAAALLAAWLPARRAARVDPTTTLRS
ncbi:MAG: ADOP family duplicated permease [Vicinamibacterales bacterium]